MAVHEFSGISRSDAERMDAAVTEQWGSRLVGSWDTWIEWARALGDRLAASVAWRVCRALAERAKVISDFRMPSRIRLSPVPLYTRFTDVWDAADRLREVVESKQYEAFPAERSRVT